ncbi:MAG TPA: RecX family transcriptional regulator [Candidatus Cloacimonadota bacterium]|nr:RecX family transcriptional regulator [Candidatus Cloacimonadota bacterium]
MNLSIWKKNNSDRVCLIKIGDSIWGSLPEKRLLTLFQSGVGSFEITEEQAQVIKDYLFQAAWDKLLDWLARQEHSSLESEEYLKRQSFHPSIIERCLAEAKEKKFIDDERYCRLLIESLKERGKSPHQIQGKLIEKHLPSSLWEPILAEIYSPEEELNNLRAQAEKAYLQYRHLDKRACYEHCLAALYRKGFDLEKARTVVADIVYRPDEKKP